MKTLRNPLSHAVVAIALGASMASMAQTTVATTTTPLSPAKPVSTAPASKDLATDLARASLAKQGISNPTRAQLAAERKAIADQRAQGKGWGVIAQSLGLNLGQVVSGANRARRDDRKEDREDGKPHSEKHHEKQGGHKNTDHRSTAPSGGEHHGGDHGNGSHGGGGHGGGKGK